MKLIAIAATALLLSGCASFKLGAVFYCPAASACTFQHATMEK